jgi:3-hydroxymyristoyl/3-hydroxydecanoyl-(acyl carrier protein) dehydratase
LANTRGVLWDPAEEPPRDDGPVDPPPARCTKDRFDAVALMAFRDGRVAECFGDPWRQTLAHVRTPRIESGRLWLLDEVTQFDPDGGPWGRGYLCASTAVTPDDWFFSGHFHNDPCMPGTLMVEAGIQAMAFYLTALGCTTDRDGWRFEPVPEERCLFRCRGQVTPASKLVTYEMFVSGFSAGPRPTLYADLLGTVDGVKAFHVRRIGLRLVPDAPLEHWQVLGPPAIQRSGDLVPLSSLGGLVGYVDDPRAIEMYGHRIDYRAVLATAWGWPPDDVRAMGWDATHKYPRLPGPPFLFVTRVVEMDVAPGGRSGNACLTAEYDVPSEGWFFNAGGTAAMPMAVLFEIAMQPCGVMSANVGDLGRDVELSYRVLDGHLTVTGQVRPGVQIVRTRLELRSVTDFAGCALHSFAVECHADGVPILAGTLTFALFPRGLLDVTFGLPTTEADRTSLSAPDEVTVQLRDRPARYFGGSLRLPGPMLLMLDRVTGFWPDGGAAGLGRVRAEKDIDPADWYFKAHFYEDPVQPGSLGLEAVCQLLQFFCIETGLGAGVPDAVFEPIMRDRPTVWKFRGQVLPTDGMITI